MNFFLYLNKNAMDTINYSFRPATIFYGGDFLRGLMNLIETVSAEEVRNQLVFLGGYIRTAERN